jgi:preprotein translocase subunit SecA
MDIIAGLNKLLGDPNEKELKKLWPIVHAVKRHIALPETKALTLDDLPKKTEEFKKRVADGEGIDALLPEAFAVACRACELIKGKTVSMGAQTFTWDMVPFDVQILGGIALHLRYHFKVEENMLLLMRQII